MQPTPNSTNRNALASASHPKSYDPSAPYRALLRPPPPPVTTGMPSYNEDVPATNIDPKTGAAKRIPQFYYPRYGDADDPPPGRPDFVDPREINPNFLRTPPIDQPVPHGAYPYPQPVAWPGDPYSQNPYYPYATPYIIPLSTNVPEADPAATLRDQSKSDVIAQHKKDADLSRLEVYHFTPKNTTSTTGTASTQPIVQYHVYPYAPGTAPPPSSIPMPFGQRPQPPQPYPPYPYPWNAYPPNVPSSTETKARASQTDEPSTKNRAVSPVHFSYEAPPPPPIYDDDGYPYVDQRTMHTDRYNVPTGRIHRHFYDMNRSTLIADCRCLDCQRERSKVLNYYPD